MATRGRALLRTHFPGVLVWLGGVDGGNGVGGRVALPPPLHGPYLRRPGPLISPLPKRTLHAHSAPHHTHPATRTHPRPPPSVTLPAQPTPGHLRCPALITANLPLLRSVHPETKQ